MVTAGVFVWDSQKLVPEDRETGAQSRKSCISVEVVGPDATVSATAVLSNVLPSEAKTSLPASISEGSTNASGPMEVSDNTFSEKNDE